jgi:hypothetical protein
VEDLSQPLVIDLGKTEVTPLPDKTGEKKLEKENRTGEFGIAPIPISNPTLGHGLALVGGYIYPMNKGDIVIPDFQPSSLNPRIGPEQDFQMETPSSPRAHPRRILPSLCSPLK